MLDPLTGNGNQPEVVELQDLGRGTVAAQGLFQRLHHFLTVAALVHVDEIDDDDAAQIAQADLADDFLDGVHVGLDDGVFETGGLAYIFARINVDRHQRFRLIDHDIAAALQPHFRLQRLVDLLRQAKLLVQRNLFGVELYSPHQCGLKAVGEAQNSLVLLFVVHPDGREVGCDLVAQDAFDHVQIVIDQGRRLAVFGARLDLFPQAFEEADVSPKFLFIGSLRPRSER